MHCCPTRHLVRCHRQNKKQLTHEGAQNPVRSPLDLAPLARPDIVLQGYPTALLVAALDRGHGRVRQIQVLGFALLPERLVTNAKEQEIQGNKSRQHSLSPNPLRCLPHPKSDDTAWRHDLQQQLVAQMTNTNKIILGVDVRWGCGTAA